MSRRKRVYAKPEAVDPRYDSHLVSSLVNKVMHDGKKSLAERIVYAAIDRVNEGSETVDPLGGSQSRYRERQAARRS